MQSCALVFAGGGGKGAYEVGVWKALRDLGLEPKFDCVAGTSVGALNAALFSRKQLDAAERVWNSIFPSIILKKDRHARAIFSQSGLASLLRENLSLEKGAIPAYICCSKLVSKHHSHTRLLGMNLDEKYEPCYFNLDDLPTEDAVSVLLASSALPVVYDKVRIGEDFYRDGGILGEHNMPYKEMVRRGYQKIFAVSLSSAPEPNNLVQQEKFETYVGSNLIAAEIMVIHPSISLGNPHVPGGSFLQGTVDFNPENIRWRMDLGFKDCTVLYKRALQYFLD